MFMYSVEYVRADSIDEIERRLVSDPDAKVLAGGQSLLATMKLRLARPTSVIDLGAIPELRGISVEGGTVTIGAMTRHAEVASSAKLNCTIPALSALAGGIGDRMVRNRGTIGGSVANNDPAADYPAGLLALNATIVTNRREIAADKFFLGLYETALGQGEIITRVIFPVPQRAAYMKFKSDASRFAMAGVFVADLGTSVRVAVTGFGAGVFRVPELEKALTENFTAEAIAHLKVPLKELSSDLHATAEFRSHIATVMARRAVEAAIAQDKDAPNEPGPYKELDGAESQKKDMRANDPAGVEAGTVQDFKYIGKPLLRREDRRLLSGRGRYVDDVRLPETAFCAFVRSPHAHARILEICTDDARRMPGVLRVLTAQDWVAAGMGELTVVHPMPFSNGKPMNAATRPAFASDKVRHVGDIVAAIVAETQQAALDAAEAVEVSYEPLPSVSDVARALDENAPLVHEQFGSNAVFEVTRGDKNAIAASFAKAAKVIELSLPSSRVAANPIEPRSYLCSYDPADDCYTIYATTQQPHYLRRWLAVYSLYIPEHKIQVISPDVGGSFGIKGNFPVELPTVVWASRLLRRPVKWTATRSEALLSDTQARDHHTVARMAFDVDGRILALEVDTVAALGGYLSNFAPSIPGNSYPQMIAGLYRTPQLGLRIRGAYTNTVPVDAYRGSGRPEAAWVNERLVENGARELGIDVVELRRRNLLAAADFPYSSPSGRTYDSGNPPALFEKLLSIADYPSLRARQSRLREQGSLMGIGLALFLDKAGTGPSRNLAMRGGLHGGYESALVRVHSDGKVVVFAGTHSHGQGHEITYAQIAAHRMQLDIDDIRIIEGDTDKVPFGNGTWGGRSVSVAGTAILKAADEVMTKMRKLAAHLVECDEADIDYKNQVFAARTTGRSVTFRQVADIAYHGADLPRDGSLSPGLEATSFYDPPDNNDPQAMHLAVVTVEPDTGVVKINDYYTVDDSGVVVNPMIVEGQVQGGLAQGIGQAMFEQVRYDQDNGQLLTGSFMDYAMPRADCMPPLQSAFIETPAPSNPLGVKGASESGTIGAPAAIGNAIVDALWHLGVRHLCMPFTPERVWQAIQQARSDACAEYHDRPSIAQSRRFG